MAEEDSKSYRITDADIAKLQEIIHYLPVLGRNIDGAYHADGDVRDAIDTWYIGLQKESLKARIRDIPVMPLLSQEDEVVKVESVLAAIDEWFAQKT